MKEPYNGNVNYRLVSKRFKDKIFYYVSTFDNYKYSLKPCMLSAKTSWLSLYYFDENLCLDKTFSVGANWEYLFDNFEEAEKEVKRLNSLYFDGFKYKPFLSVEILEKHKEELLKIEKKINELLYDNKNFQGVDFCNVGARGIQIRGHHKDIKNYTYGTQPTIKYDFSNKDGIPLEFYKMWKEYDTPQKLARELDFIRFGEKYGWD